MIYTVTLRPHLERFIEVEELIYDDINQIVGTKQRAGGRGINVSRVIKVLGGESVALGFVGGYTGLEMEGQLVKEELVCDFTKISGETKTNVIIFQRKKKLQTVLSTSDAAIDYREISAFNDKLKALQANSYVVVNGSLPKDVSDDFYAQMITTLKKKDIKVFLDSDESALKKGVHAGPYLIKPNIHEFGRLTEKNIVDIDGILEYAKLYTDDVEYITVSLGMRGVVGISKNERYHVIPPKVKVRSSIGAGDSLLAGMVYVLHGGGAFEDALATGVACGTASVLNPEYRQSERKDIEKIKKEIIIKKL